MDIFKSIKFPFYCTDLDHTSSNAFLYNYSNIAPLKSLQSSITCDFTKDVESKINTNFQIINF